LSGQYKILAFVDIETTGLSPASCEMIELGILLYKYDEQLQILTEIDRYNGFEMPTYPIYPHITRLTGITNEMVKGQRFDDQKVIELFKQADGIIAHNASFDRSFLLKRYSFLQDWKWHCSMRSVKWKEYGFINKKLTTLLDAHGISRENAHRAMDDIEATAFLLQKINPEGNIYLTEVLKKVMSKPKSAVKR